MLVHDEQYRKTYLFRMQINANPYLSHEDRSIRDMARFINSMTDYVPVQLGQVMIRQQGTFKKGE